MARKTLLTESELHRFMKLAEMHPISDDKIEEMGYGPIGARDVEEEVEDELVGLDVSPEGDVDVVPDVDVEEPVDDLEAEVPVDADLEAKFAEFMTQVAAVAQEVLGIEVEVEGGEEEVLDVVADEEDIAPVGDIEGALEGGEEDVEVGAVEEFEEDKRYTAKKEEPDEDIRKGAEKRGGEGTLAKTKGHGRVDYVKEEEVSSEDDIVAEVARRVAARLQRENHQAEVVDQLAERIMKRLTK